MEDLIKIIDRKLYQMRFQENENLKKNKFLYGILSSLSYLYDQKINKTEFDLIKNILNNGIENYLEEIKKGLK